MSRRRVVVTGMGVVSPVGNNVKEFWNSLLESRNGIGKITRFDPSEFDVQIAGEVKGFDPTDRLEKKEARRMDRYTQYALYATDEALEDAQLKGINSNLDRIGVYLASGIGGVETLENELRKMINESPSRVSPFLVPMMIPDIAAGWISIKYGYRGPNFSIVSACASASHAIGEAFETILRGDADIMIAGGSEAPITPLSLAGFASMKALSTRNDEPEKASRPFDKERDGFVMGEGAGVVVLESLESAIKRGVKIYAEIVGYAATADAYHITAPAPDGEGAYKVMKIALKKGNVPLEEVDYINAHGTSTKLNDKIESDAIKRLFNERAYKIPISSTKSMTGHLLGAAGGIETIATVLTIHTGWIHPTRNLENPDPECDLDYVPKVARKREVRYALSNSFGFGGHNAALVFKAFKE
jgi:3-oxoacyl-[acyl-carrier-protein] synthase II